MPITGDARVPAGGSVVSPLIWRFHFFAGVIVAPFLVILCLTGIAYALAPQLDDLIYHRQFHVDRVASHPMSLASQVAVAKAAAPGVRLVSIDPAPAPDRTTAVNFANGTTTMSGIDERRTVYVDPYSGEVRGTLITASGRPPFQQWLRELHGQLHLGDVGRLYSELAASWLPFLATGGLLLWLGRRRRRRLDLLIPRRGLGRGRGRVRVWHAVAGVWLIVGVAFISVTGLTWSHFAGDRFGAVVSALNGRTPELTPSVGPYAAGVSRVGVDTVLDTARSEGLSGPLRVVPPVERSDTYLVSEISDSWPIRAGTVAVDPHTGRAVARLDFSGFPLAAKLTTLGIDAHQGTLFGVFNQAVLIAFALGLLFMAGAGYRMWWLRRPRGVLMGAPPARVSWQRLPLAGLAAAAAVAVAIGVVLPVFGVSLLVFLLLDSLGPWVARRRAGSS